MKYIILNKNSVNFKKYKNQIYALRHKVFKEKLNWKVNSVEGYKEIDYFDSLKKVSFIIAVNNEDKVLGCMRLLPTTHDYMLEKVFPQLLVYHPKQDNIWEISRFAIDPNLQKETSMLSLNLPTLLILEGMCEFAKNNNITTFIAATTATLNRLVRTIGMDTQVVGNKLKIDDTNVIALKILMNSQTFEGVKNALHTQLQAEA